MQRTLLITLIFALAIISPSTIFSQEAKFEQWSLNKKNTVTFPLDHKILRPRLAYPDWDTDYDKFYDYLTPALRKTQASLNGTYKGVLIAWTPNSIMPHAQLDTSTMLNDKEKLRGTWRMLTFRTIRFNDSVDIPTKIYYRLADSLLGDMPNDEAFAVITDDDFKLYLREAGKKEFKKKMSSNYKIENRRFIMLYKMIKSSAGILQFGIDENGYLILNYPKVVEHIKKGAYFSYYTMIDQYIFEKVKE